MTAASAPPPAPAGHAVGLPALWFGLFGAPAAWSLQLLVSYALTAHACFPGADRLAAQAGGGVWPVAFGVSAIAAIAGVSAAVTAWRSWGATRQAREGRDRFMALAGMLLSGLFLLGIAMNAAPLFLFQLCG